MSGSWLRVPFAGTLGASHRAAPSLGVRAALVRPAGRDAVQPAVTESERPGCPPVQRVRDERAEVPERRTPRWGVPASGVTASRPKAGRTPWPRGAPDVRLLAPIATRSLSVMIADTIRERYLRDPLPIRLGGLAADLARIASWVDNPKNHLAVAGLLEESKYFCEWAAPDAPLDVQAVLAEVQIQLACWHRAWLQGQSPPQLSAEARRWSDHLLQLSGLLD